jgi:hypothetical protein
MRDIIYLAALYVIIAALVGFWPFEDTLLAALCGSLKFVDCIF